MTVVTVVTIVTVATVMTVMAVVTVVTKKLCTPQNETYLKPTYLCNSSYCRDSSDSSDSSGSSDSSDSNDSSDSSDQTTLYTKASQELRKAALRVGRLSRC